MKLRFHALAALLMALAGVGCDDALGPRNWEVRVDTITLYSLDRPELQGLPSAFDFVDVRLLLVEALGATGNWDVALVEEGGELVLAPPGAIEGLDPIAGIAALGSVDFGNFEQAPGDSADYVLEEIVPLETGATYVVRSHQSPRVRGCHYYAKVQTVEIREEEGWARFRFTRNPFCNDRALVPPE